MQRLRYPSLQSSVPLKLQKTQDPTLSRRQSNSVRHETSCAYCITYTCLVSNLPQPTDVVTWVSFQHLAKPFMVIKYVARLLKMKWFLKCDKTQSGHCVLQTHWTEVFFHSCRWWKKIFYCFFPSENLVESKCLDLSCTFYELPESSWVAQNFSQFIEQLT